jgi:hypothetical protein
MMQRVSVPKSNLMLIISNCNVSRFDGNCANLELDVVNSDFKRSEMTDSYIKGKILRSNLTNTEFNRSTIIDLEIIDCATNGMETEGAFDELDMVIKNAIDELEEE